MTAGVLATWIALVTAYAPSCGDSGLTFYGLRTGWGTISAPQSIPAYTRLAIDQYGEGVVTDRGPAITEGRLDVWMPTCRQALQWGRRLVRVSVLPAVAPEPPADDAAAVNVPADDAADQEAQ